MFKSIEVKLSICSLLFLLFASACSAHGIRDQIKSMISSQSVPFPAGAYCASCLIYKWSKQDANAKSEVFPVSNMDAAMAAFPAKVREKVKALMFGLHAKTSFEDFTIDVSKHQAVRRSYLGFARRVGPNIELGMVAAEVVGLLVTKVHTFHRETCRKVLWVFNKCNTHTITEPRGYNADEVTLVDKALMSETFHLFAQKVDQLNL